MLLLRAHPTPTEGVTLTIAAMPIAMPPAPHSSEARGQRPSPFAIEGMSTEEMMARFHPSFRQRLLMRRATRLARERSR
jgi:hypothetical protein